MFDLLFSILTELCQVNAAQRPLNARAHIPEHRINECYNHEEAKNQRPNEIQQIRQSHQLQSKKKEILRCNEKQEHMPS